MTMKALVTGATGLVGRELLRRLENARVLTRDVAESERRLGDGVKAWAWQPSRQPAPAASFDGVDAVFHLAGEPVAAGRWTAERKQSIKDSRVLGTRHLVGTLTTLPAPPRVLICASGVDFYGDRGDTELREGSSRGRGFLSDVCEAWEAEARAAEGLGIRVVLARLALVLAPSGGALERMLPPFRLGLGGKLGDGRQWLPWVHLDDAVGLLLHAASDERVSGPLNVVAPEAATNAEFTRALGQALGKPVLLAVPRLALRVMFGEISQALLDSRRVVPGVALDTQYVFRHPRLAPALVSCVQG